MSNSTTGSGCCGGSTTSGHCHSHDIPAHTHNIGHYIAEGLTEGLKSSQFDPAIYMRPYKAFEEDNKKYHIFRVPGFNDRNLDIVENWNNKEKAMRIDVRGRQYVGRDDEVVNISLYFDHEVYDKYEVNIVDGLCYVIFYEIINEAPPIMRLGLEEK